MKLALQLGTLSAVNIGVSFLLQWYVLVQLGPGTQTDALFAGMTVPQLMLTVFTASLMHVLVPLYTAKSEECLHRDVWAFLAVLGGLFGLLAVLLGMLATWWVPLTVPGFDAEGTRLTVELTRIQLVGMLFSAVNTVQWAASHARRRFVWAEVSQILAGGIAMLGLVWALPRFGIVAAAWINILRMALQTLFLAPSMGWPVRPDFNSPAIRQAMLRIKPLLLGTAYYKTDPLIDRVMLSMAGSGSLSLYYLAQQIYGAVSQVLNKAIATPMVPTLSLLHGAGDAGGFMRAYRRKLLQASLISLAGLLVFGYMGREVLSHLVGYGSFGVGSVAALWGIMIWLGGMFIGGVAGQISSSAYYARGDTVTPTRIGIFSFTFYVPVKIALFYYFGVVGMAAATSLFFIFNFAMQHRLLRRDDLGSSM